ncbi:MAG: dienelactone hydrolase family protein [Bacteroidaceae bacterium]|nr:dienelactone hydrolase family protein [Bacteroidaceae bacterium]
MASIRRHISLIIISLLSLVAYAQEKGFTLEAKRGVIPGGYNFWVTTPYFYNDNSDKMALVVFLHGRSLCGHDLNRVRRYGTIAAIEKGMQLEAVCVAPQNPGGPWKPSKVLEVVEYMERHYRIEPTRIYVLGMSLGGFGTMDFVGTYPDKVAAAMAFCGGSTLRSYEGLSKLPLWIVHGTADTAVPVRESRKVAEGIRSNYPSDMLLYSELPGVNHGRLTRLFYQLDTYDWLFCHNLLTRRADKTHSITVQTLNRPYKANMVRDNYPDEEWWENALYGDDYEPDETGEKEQEKE